MSADTITPETAAFFGALTEALDTNADVPIEDEAAVSRLCVALARAGWGVGMAFTNQAVELSAPDGRWFRFVWLDSLRDQIIRDQLRRIGELEKQLTDST